MVPWFGLHAFTAKGEGSVPGGGTMIFQAVWHGQKKKKKELATFKHFWFLVVHKHS